MTNSSDRLSLLPDPLLFTIMSLLPFNEAVRTSILSKRWLHLWEKLPILEFNEFLFVKPSQSFVEQKIKRNYFLSFLTCWLDNRKEGFIERFSLRLSYSEEAREIIERCVAFAIQQKVKELWLNFSDPIWERRGNPNEWLALFELPSCVYKQKTIESLKLFSCSFFENDLTNLHALKEVSFGWMEVTHKAIITLLRNCKMIESLTLKNCWNSSQFEIDYEESKLKRLVVKNCYFKNSLFEVNTPNLCYFKYVGEMNIFKIKTPLALEEANLDFNSEFESFGLGLYLYNLIKDLYMVKVLTVCSYVLQVLPTGPKLRMERNMCTKHLTMKLDLHEYELCGISFLLKSCPMLECLTLQLGLGRNLPDVEDLVDLMGGQASMNKDDEDLIDHSTTMWMDSDDEEVIKSNDDERIWFNNLPAHECLRSTLRFVEVKNFVGTGKELNFLYYLIRCGKVLENINVYVKKGEAIDNEDMAFYCKKEKFLMMTDRASDRLQISFYY